MQEYFEDIPMQSIDCYWYVKEYSLGNWAYSYGISGKITVSAEYVEEIKAKYTDWKKQADIYYTDALYKQHLQEYSCVVFRDFWKAQNYLMSEA